MDTRNNLFPVFLKIDALSTLIVGGGNVGMEKLNALLKSSPAAQVTLVAGLIRDEIKAVAVRNSALKLVERDFRDSDLRGKDLVVLATDNPDLHRHIRALARRKHILINVADTPELCDFYLGSVVTRGNLKIGISTNGKSPTMAKRIREDLEESLPEDINDLLNNMHAIRAKMKGDFAEKVKRLNELTASWLKKMP